MVYMSNLYMIQKITYIMKVVSLAPNITDILYELNYQDNIIGCTKHYDLPKTEKIGGWPVPNISKIKELNPDIIFSSDPLQSNISKHFNSDIYNVYHTNPTRFLDIYNLILSIGSEIGRNQKAKTLVNELNKKVNNITQTNVKNRPTVYCEEWDSPTKVSGNWIPDMVEISGGSYPYLNSGDRSKDISFEEFVKYDPDIFISHICGCGLNDKFRVIRDEWNINCDVYFVHDDYMNNLSTRTIKGIKILSEIINNKNYGVSKLYTEL